MSPRSSGRTFLPPLHGLLLLVTAVLSIAVGLILPTSRGVGADLDEQAAALRPLGVAGTFTNHTLINLTGEPVNGFAFKFLTVKPDDIMGSYTNMSWSGMKKGTLSPTDPSTTRLGWFVSGSESSIPVGGKGHFGYELAIGVTTGAADITGEWTGATTGNSHSVPASSVHNYKTPAWETVTPSATPTETPSGSTQPTPMLPMVLAAHPLQRPAPRGVAADADPPWIDFEITNNWLDPDLPDPRQRTISVHRYVKIVAPPDSIRLEYLIDDHPFLEDAKPVDVRPVMIEFGRSVDLRIGPLTETDTGMVVYYSAQPATPPSGREAGISYWAFTGLKLEPNPTAIAILTLTPPPTIVPTPIPTPTRTRPPLYFPSAYYNHHLFSAAARP